jgi:serine/threonine protein kinase
MHRDFFIHNKIRGYYDSDLDLWSFGVTIYQCATGMFPFKPRVGIKNDKRTM